MSFGEFIAMGGYAAFVWPAYAVTFIVLIGNVLAARRSQRRAVQEARQRARAGQAADPYFGSDSSAADSLSAPAPKL